MAALIYQFGGMPMRGMWSGIGCLMLLSLVGCVTSDAHLRPPQQPEELVDVPDEKRYQQPPEPPKSTNPDGTPKGTGNNGTGGLPKSPTRPGAPGGPSSTPGGY